MSKALKIIGILLGGIVILITAALLYIILFFDPNAYKPQISAAVEHATGRQLSIEGDIGLSLFPWIGMELDQISLSNASGFGDTPFARINSAEVKLKLLPLLKQEVDMQAVRLRGLRLNLEVNADGKTNWDDLSQSGQADATATPDSSDDIHDGSASLAALAIGGLEISDAHVSYDDRSTGERYVIQELNLLTGPVSLTQPLDVSLNSRFSSTQPEISGSLDLRTRIIADLLKGEQHRLEKLQLGVDFDSPEFATRGQVKLNSDISIDLANEQYSLSGLVIETDLTNADLPTGKVKARLSTDISANLKQETATVSALKISAYDVNINGDLNVAKIMSTPEFNGKLAIAEFNARELLQTLQQTLPEMADAETLKHVAMNLSFSGTPEAIKIRPLQLTLDDSHLSGWLEAEMPADKPMPALRYRLAIDSIDADRYLPPTSEETVAPPASAGAVAVNTMPMELLRELDIDGDLTIGELKITNLHVSDIKTPLMAKDGMIRLQPDAKLYQGTYKGDMRVDARKDSPVFNLDESLRSIEAGPLVKDLTGDDMISGTGNISARLSTRGHTPKAMTETLNGDISILFNNGSIKNFNLAQMVREAKAKLKNEPAPAASSASSGTDFTELSASFNIINGVVHNNDLSTKSPYIRITGNGSADLAKEQLDYTVNAAIVKSEQGEGGAALDDLKGLTIPIRISGSFTEPKFDLQYDEILKAKAKETLERKKAEAKQKLEAEKEAKREELEQKAEQKKEELKQQAEDKLKDKLKGLFK